MKTNGKTARAKPVTDDDRRFTKVIEAFTDEQGIDQGRMFGSLGLKVQGKVFAMQVKGHLVVKLPKPRVDALVSSGAATYFDPGHGRLMKEWVAVDSGNRNWVALAREACAFVKGGGR